MIINGSINLIHMTKSGVLEAESYLDNKTMMSWWHSGAKKTGMCPDSKYLSGYVENEERYRKIVPCGKKWCEVCGQEGSLLHRQRFARGMRKILGAEILGYWVFTFPVKCREMLADGDMLGKFQDYINNLLMRQSWCKGLVSTWHYGGDRHRGVYHPHLNVLTNNNGREKLNYDNEILPIKRKAKKWICKHIAEIDVLPVVEYHYYKGVGSRIHKWRYVCRPTLLLCGDDMWRLDLIPALHNFRSIRWRGHWDKYSGKVDKGIEILNDEKIDWVYKGEFDEIQEETFEQWNYVEYGVFEKRAPP